MRERIISLIPPDHTCYVELFAGAAWVLLAKPPSQVEILNDLDEELISFFRVVKDDTLCEQLVRSFEWDLVSRSEFKRLAELDPQTLSPLERAHRFYYLIMAGWGGELAYPRFQTSITDGGYGNRLVGAIKTPAALRARLEPVRDRLRTVLIENLTWEACFARYDRPSVVMY
ncbi:MAG: DNA adenine methylase, partial [Chloroflexota bacterium]|nr:DNA adenine methylase [Chloroflexota bacterium]